MKVLVISFRFAPFNSIGSNRINALVEFFKKNDIEYKVITSYVGKHKQKGFIPDENVHYVSWFDFRNFKKFKCNEFIESKNLYNSSKSVEKTSLKNKIILFIKTKLLTLLYPDPYITWVVNAKSVGAKLVKEFAPDVIYSSSYPYSSHITASYLAKKYKLKWFAELRDPWVNNHVKKNNSYFIDFVERKYSKYVLNYASRIVTVSNIWKENFENLYKTPCLLVRNGYVNNSVNSVKTIQTKKIDTKTILYTGSIFPKNQNIKSFLIYFNELACKNPKFKFCYVGGQVNYLKTLIGELKLNRGNFILMGKVPYSESVALQKEADYLLVLNWVNDKNDNSKGIIPGKFYEYLGANKPIILWNEGQVNELLDLSININKKLSGKKILIINHGNSLMKEIESFSYSSNMEVVQEFSRENQFNQLLREF